MTSTPCVGKGSRPVHDSRRRLFTVTLSLQLFVMAKTDRLALITRNSLLPHSALLLR